MPQKGMISERFLIFEEICSMAVKKFKGLRAALWCRYVFSRFKIEGPDVFKEKYSKHQGTHPVTDRIQNNQPLLDSVEAILAMENVPWNKYYSGKILPNSASLLMEKLEEAFTGTINYLENGPFFLFKVLTASTGKEATKYLIKSLDEYIEDNGQTLDNFPTLELQNKYSISELKELCEKNWLSTFNILRTRLPNSDVLIKGLSFDNEDVFYIHLNYAFIVAQFTTDTDRFSMLDRLLFSEMMFDGIRYFDVNDKLPKELWFEEPFMLEAFKAQTKDRTITQSESEYYREYL